MNIYTQCFILAFLGFAVKVLTRYGTLKSDAALANVKFNTREFISREWPTWLTSIIILCIGMFFIEDTTSSKELKSWLVKLSFVSMGYMGTDLFVKVMGGYKKAMFTVIDRKTTERDMQTGTVHTPTPLPDKNGNNN